jgi:hypothetical protein
MSEETEDADLVMTQSMRDYVWQASLEALNGLCAAIKGILVGGEVRLSGDDIHGVAVLAHAVGTALAVQHFGWCADGKILLPENLSAVERAKLAFDIGRKAETP